MCHIPRVQDNEHAQPIFGWTTLQINKNSLLGYKLCLCPAFLFPVWIPVFCAFSRSLHAKVFVILSKWPDFHAKVLIWLWTHDLHPVHPLWGVGGVACTKRKLHSAKLVIGVDFNGRGCAGVSKTILSLEIYCTKLNPESSFQSGS